MFSFQHDIELSPLTTFHIPAKTRLYAEYSSLRELIYISRQPEFYDNEVLHIGGGSNLLFLHDFDGLVLHSAMRDIKMYEKDNDTLYVIADAGLPWTEFVDWCLDHGLSGMENLAGIPGEVGAAPVQNVGAYGVEAKDIIWSVECFDVTTRTTVLKKPEECGFDYRWSRFKGDWKGQYFVLRVAFRLRRSDRAANLSYDSLARLPETLGHYPTPREVADEVIRLRNSKLPDPALIGSAGSFFKNPVVHPYFFQEEIGTCFSDMPHHNTPEGLVKLSAAWLIDHAGLKGTRVGGAYVFPSQPLVIANDGTATAADVEKLAEKVRHTVRMKFGIPLEREVNYIDTDIHVTVLGSGTSKGIPEIGCLCPVCTSPDPRDKRLRASVLVRTHDMNILIDASPDLRQQALTHGIDHLDALLITHSHYDHVGGLDDLRPLLAGSKLPIYVREDVDGDLRRRLDYCFREHPYPGVPQLHLEIINDRPFFIKGLKIIPIEVHHGKLPIYGYRIGDFAYLTDVKTIDDDQLDKLEGVRVLIINALRWTPEHFAHLTVDEALALIERIRPERAYLTHFSHAAGTNAELEQRLPPHVRPLYDGLTFTVS